MIIKTFSELYIGVCVAVTSGLFAFAVAFFLFYIIGEFRWFFLNLSEFREFKNKNNKNKKDE